MSAKKILFPFVLAIILPGAYSLPPESNIVVDAGKHIQVMEGFGVNINAAWWLDGDYRDTEQVKPAIDLLIDSLGASIFRVVIEEMDWETVNDDRDPQNFNWDYFNSVFSNARFKGIWNTLHYLNKRGITDKLIISFMGGPPAAAPLTEPDPARSWMGNTNFSISEAMEDEFVESIAALLYYARKIENIRFTLVSPMNETDIISATKSADHPNGIVEGPDMPDAVQFVRVIKKLAEKLDRIGLEDIRLVAPDAAGDKLFFACFDEMIKDPYLMGKLALWGVHQYGKDAANYLGKIENDQNPVKKYYVTETAGIRNLMGQLDDNVAAHIFWDGFDCVYQHARRNGYGSNPPNDWVFWEGDQGRPLLAYDPLNHSWQPRKQFYEFSQIFKFIKPGAEQIAVTSGHPDIPVYACVNNDGRLVITGRNNTREALTVNGTINNFPGIGKLNLFITNAEADLKKCKDVVLTDNTWHAVIPAETVFTMTGLSGKISITWPEPPGWYAGDMHVHRNCGEVTPLFTEDSLAAMMKANNLSVISLLADMGNGEVKDSKADLPKVTGRDAAQSTAERILHWDAEWHFDPAGVTFENKALGGHLVLLGLKEANTVWEESTHKILEWGKKQNAITGFCHMQYLNDSVQNDLTCCIPIDFPVETALGTIDFLSEDVWLNDAAIHAYYKILNCGFRPGWCAGTDFPCNNADPLGSQMTYVQVKEEPLTYSAWINGIKNGRTVVTTNGHIEFLDLRVNGSSTPGDEIKLTGNSQVNISATWTSIRDEEGTIEIVCNGRVVAKDETSAGPSKPATLNFDMPIKESSWICARRMNSNGHQSHTAPVFITVDDRPVRASAEDAEYFAAWIDNILENLKEGGTWRKYFTKNIGEVRARYKKAAGIYKKIATEARSNNPSN